MDVLDQLVLGVISACILIYGINVAHTRVIKYDMLTTVLASVVVACGLLLIVMQQCKQNRRNKSEHFEEALPPNDSMTKLFSLLGIQNTGSSAKNVGSIVESVNTLKQGDYNENTYGIETGLTLYYSAFSRNSYPKPGVTIVNISPYFSSPNSCPDVKIDDTHLRFLMEPNFSRETGFSLNGNSMSGPKCHQMGVNGNDQFTIFTVLKFSSFSQDQMDPYEIFQLYANTMNNIGVYFMISNKIERMGMSYGVKLMVGYGSHNTYTASYKSGNESSYTELITINPSHTYMFVLVKKPAQIVLYMYPNIENIGTGSSSRVKILDEPIEGDENVLLSNKPMTINRHQNIMGNMHTFGVYNQALEDNSMSLLFVHTQRELHKTNQLLQELANKINTLQGQIETQKSCPYTDGVCNTCTEVKDWRNLTNVILNGNDDCLSKIDEFCINNPKHELCTCWNPNNSMSHTEQCKNYINIFRKNKMISPDNLDAETLEIIKQKNGLCSCKDVETLKDVIKDHLAIANMQGQVPRPKRINQNYGINRDDIDAYNKGSIDSSFQREDTQKLKDTKVDDRNLVKDPFQIESVVTNTEKTFLDRLFS